MPDLQHRTSRTLAALVLSACAAAGAGFLVAGSTRVAGQVNPSAGAVVVGGAPTPRSLQYTEVAPGLLARSLFATTEAGPHAVEIVDILVAPGQSVDIPAGPVAVLLSIEAGAPVLSVDGKAAAVEPGRLLAINQGGSLTIDNRQERRPVVARLIKLQEQGN